MAQAGSAPLETSAASRGPVPWRELTEILCRNAPAVFAGNFAVAGLTVYVLWNYVPNALLVGWGLTVYALTGIRMVLVRRYGQAPRSAPEARRWAWYFALSSTISGCLWGAGTGWVFFVPEEPLVLVYAAIVITGMSGGSVGSLSAFLPAYYGFAIPAISPFAVSCFAKGGETYTVMGFLALFLLAVNLVYSRTIHRTIRESVALRFDNVALVGRLTAEKERAEGANQAKSRFLAAASHDLRQPMHALGLFVARLEQLPHEPETNRLIGNLEASVRALQDLLDALLDISRLDAGVEKPQFQPVQVEALFDHVEREFASAAEQKGIALRFRPSPLWVMSDPRLLHRMLLNLVSNAIRYTAQGGVLVACRRRGGHAVIEVRDAGRGIPVEMQGAVFKEFVQLDNPERDRAKGLGLGLTIVEGTAALLGHALTLDSAVGRGSCFRIEASIAEPPAPGAEPGAPSPQPDLSGLAVLSVEDDALARPAVVELLESWGCRVHAAGSGEEALLLARTIDPPDVIACDFRLPGRQNAIDLIGQLQAQFGIRVPAFLISGDTDPAVLRAAEASGLTLLHKPVRPARLRALIYRLVRPA